MIVVDFQLDFQLFMILQVVPGIHLHKAQFTDVRVYEYNEYPWSGEFKLL